MKKKYFILALTFLCLLVGQISFGQESGGDYVDTNDMCDKRSTAYIPGMDCELDEVETYNCNPASGYYREERCDPCDHDSKAYNVDDCIRSLGGDPGNSGDPNNPTPPDSGDVCDPDSYAYNYLGCYYPGGTGGGSNGGSTGGTGSTSLFWFLDMDGDGYASDYDWSTKSPGLGWKQGNMRWGDCNDLNPEIHQLNSCEECKKESECIICTTICTRGYVLNETCECKPCNKFVKANLADLVYDSHNGIPNDYSKLPSNVTIIPPASVPDIKFTDTDIGFNSTLYRVDNGNGNVEYVYATEGSSLELQDWLNNGQQSIGHIADQYTLSVANARALLLWANSQGTPKISFTGHSLGGGLANANALATGYPATIFNPAGLHDNTISRLGLNLNNAKNVNYYTNTGEIVDIANTLLFTPARGIRHEIGNNAVIPATIWYGSTLAGLVYSGYLHTMGSVLSVLECDD